MIKATTVRDLALNSNQTHFWVWYPELKDWIIHHAADFDDPDEMATYANHRAITIIKPYEQPT